MRLVRTILYGLLGLVLFVVVVLAAAVAWFNTGPGQRQLASLVTDIASSEDSGVQIGSIEGFVPFDMIVGDVALTDRDGSWLTIDRATLDWTPWALFRGQFHVTNLDVGTVAMLREPAPSTSTEPDEPTAFEPPSLPVDIELDQLTVGRVELPADLVGEPMVFTISGNAQLGEPSEGIQTSLIIDRVDGPLGHIGLDAAFVTGGRLTFDLTVDEPREGLIAGLAGWPSTVPVSVQLEGDGTLDAFSADLAASVGDLASASGNARIEQVANGRTFSLSITSDVAGLMEPDIAALIEGAVTLDIAGAIGNDGAMSLDRFDLSSVAGDLSVAASLAANDDLAGTLSLDAGASDVFDAILPGADWSVLQVAGTLGGTRQSPMVSLTVTGDGFAMAGFGASQLSTTVNGTFPDGLDEAAPPVAFDLTVDAAGVAIGDAQIDPLIATVGLTASGRIDDFTQITIDTLSTTVPVGTVTGSGAASLDGTVVSFDGQVDLPDASQLATIAGMPLAGSLATDITASMQDDAFDVSLDATADGVSLGQAEAEALLGDSWTLTVAADGTVAGTVSDATVTIAGQSVQLTATGGWDGSAVDGQVSASLTGIQQLEPSVEGDVDLNVAVQGTPNALATQLTVTSASLVAGGETLTDVSISADLTDVPNAPTGTVDIAATAMGQPLAVSITSHPVDTSGNTPIDLETVSLALGSLQLDGTLRIDPTTVAITGQLSGGVDDLSTLDDLHGEEITGQASVDLALDWTEGTGQSANLQITGSQLAVPNVGSVDALEITADGTDLLAAPGVDVAITASAISAANADIDNFSLNADGVDILGADGIRVTGTADGVSYPGAGAVEGLTFDITANGLASTPVIDLVLDLTNIMVDNQTLDAATVTATVQDPGGDMSAVATIESADADIDVTAGLVAGTGGRQFTLSAQSDVRNLTDPTLAALAEDPVTIDLAVLLGDDGGVTIDQAEISGAAGSVTATGSLTADGTIDATVTIESDAPELARPFVVDADWSDLAVNVDLAGTLQQPTVTVAVTGSDMVLADQQIGSLDLTVDGSFPDGLEAAQPAVAFTTSLNVGNVVLNDSALAPLATTLNLSATGRVDDFETISLSQLSLTAPVGTMSGSGSANVDGTAASFDGSVDVTDASLLSDLSGQTMSGALDSTISVSLDADAFTATIDATADGLALGEATADALLGDAWHLTVDAEGSTEGTISNATINLAGTAAQIDANGSWDGESVNAQADLSVADLSIVASDVSGSVQANASVTGTMETLAAQVTLTSSAVGSSGETIENLSLNADVTGIPSAITGTIDLTGNVRNQPVSLSVNARPLDPTGTSPVDLETVSLQFGSLELDGTIRFDPVALTAIGSLEGDVDDLSNLDSLTGQSLTGAATLAVTLDHSDEAGQSAQVRVTGTSLAFGDIATAASIVVTADGTDLMGTPGLDLTVTGQSVEAQDISVDTLTLTGNGDDILGSDGIRLRGSATGAAYADLITADGLEFDVTGRNLADVPMIEADIDATGLDVGGQRFGTANIVATLDDPAGDLQFDATVDGSNASVGGLDFATLRATAAGSPAAMAWTLDAQQSGASVTGAGDVTIAETITVALETLALSASAERFALSSPSTITIQEDGTVDLGSLSLAAAGGSLQVSGTVADALDLNVATNDLPLRLIALVAPGLELTGVINGTASVSGTADAPQGQFDLRATGIGTPETASLGLGTYGVTVNGSLSGGSTEFTSELTGTGSQLSVSGTVPIDGAGTVQVSGQGSFNLAVLNPLLAAGADTVAGTLAIDLTVGGTMAALTGGGTVALRDGSYRNALYGVELTGIEIDMNANTDELVVTRLVGRTPNGGTLSGSGSVVLDPTRGLPVEIQLQADNAALLDMPAVAATADANLTFTGSLAEGGELGGTVTLEQVEARLDNLGSASVPTIDVIEINPSTPEEAERIERARAAAAGEQTASVFDITMDVEVSAPNQVFVRGSGLEAEFAGDLMITGSLNQPSIRGSLDLRRGSYDILSRHLEFTQGSIRFDGRPIDPLLDFQATTTVDNVEATLAVQGRASDPQINVSSVPELPQSEVLALILFGRATDSLSPFEAVQLAASAGQLAGIGGSGPGILENVRQTLGFDRVDFTTTPGGETAIGIGQNITDNVYVEVDQGVETGASEVSVEIQLTPNITVESGVGTRGSRVGVSVEWDY